MTNFTVNILLNQIPIFTSCKFFTNILRTRNSENCPQVLSSATFWRGSGPQIKNQKKIPGKPTSKRFLLKSSDPQLKNCGRKRCSKMPNFEPFFEVFRPKRPLKNRNLKNEIPLFPAQELNVCVKFQVHSPKTVTAMFGTNIQKPAYIQIEG